MARLALARQEEAARAALAASALKGTASALGSFVFVGLVIVRQGFALEIIEIDCLSPGNRCSLTVAIP